MRASSFRWAPLILAACSFPGTLAAGIVFESAAPPPAGSPALVFDTSSFSQALGVRFHISQTTHITALGVNAAQDSSPMGILFGVIFALDDLASFPSTDPYSGGGLATAYFDKSAPDSARDRLAPLSFTFVPGDYAVVVAAQAPNTWYLNQGGLNSPGITYSNYIMHTAGMFPVGMFPVAYEQWQSGVDGIRIFMEGEEEVAVPEPSSLALMGCALVLIVLRTRPLRKNG